ncbi:hypothetical protein KJ059_01025 [Myxococcota bacterium]|nr:hypothetical protein [Myxococcota bacterium]MCZ7618840.1 hypothetical protein [Myxococcota bacterium]
MGKSIPFNGTALPPLPGRGGATLDRLASFRLTYVAIFGFILLYVFTVKAVEQALGTAFQARIAEAVRIDPATRDPVEQIHERVDGVVRNSFWTRVGGVRVLPIVVAADGMTPLYLGGRPIPAPIDSDALDASARLLPTSAEVVVSIPHNSLTANAILVVYAALLIQTLFLYERRRSRLEEARLADARAAREETAARAARIETELEALSRQVDDRVEAEVATEIESVRRERTRLQEELASLARREDALRAQSGRLQETIESERQTLEAMLDEALGDLARKDEELRGLADKLQRSTPGRSATTTPRARDVDLLGTRLRALYKNLEFDEHAIRGLIGLADEAMKLRAEESIKRLDVDVETAAVRRKVGGLPSHLTIFELGFGGKGRVYYTSGSQRRFRVLAIGAKNSQKTDLEYLSRLPRE